MFSSHLVAADFVFGLSRKEVFGRQKNRFTHFVQSIVASNYLWQGASKFRKKTACRYQLWKLEQLWIWAIKHEKTIRYHYIGDDMRILSDIVVQ